MKRNLAYHVSPFNDSDTWLKNVAQLRRRWSIFDGPRLSSRRDRQAIDATDDLDLLLPHGRMDRPGDGVADASEIHAKGGPMIERLGRNGGALFSDDERYRFLLWRTLDEPSSFTGPARGRGCMFVGLNPSTADHEEDDPTVRRCIDYARRWGASVFYMANLFAWRSTDPNVLARKAEPCGVDNWPAILAMLDRCGVVVAAWGTHGRLWGTDVTFCELYGNWKFGNSGIPPLQCLGVNADGTPKHPLYLKSAELPRPYVARSAAT